MSCSLSPLFILKLLGIGLLFGQNLFAADLGDGSDGDCLWSGGNITAGTYQCQSLTVTGINTVVTDTTGLTVLVQGEVIIDGELRADAGQGNSFTRGAGGFPGGQGASGSDGQDGSSPVSGAQGLRGSQSAYFGTANGCNGAGGSGASHSGQSPAQSGEDSIANDGNCVPITASGASAPTTTYGKPSNFKNQMLGGAGGGSGGAGESFIDGSVAGGHGGGGGGIIKIIAGQNITVRNGASLSVNGANGEDGNVTGTTYYSGGGGGGSGGSLYLASYQQIEIESGAALESLGGQGGTIPDAGTDSHGGAGDFGRIRLEDRDGVIAGANTASTPNASVGLGPSALSGQDLISDISPGCALRVLEPDPMPIQLIFVFLSLFLALVLLIYRLRWFIRNGPSL